MSWVEDPLAWTMIGAIVVMVGWMFATAKKRGLW